MLRQIEEKNQRPERSSSSLSACLVAKRSLFSPARFKAACKQLATAAAISVCLPKTMMPITERRLKSLRARQFVFDFEAHTTTKDQRNVFS